MKEVQIITKIRVKDEKEIETVVNAMPEDSDGENSEVAGVSVSERMMETEGERQAIVSDLANICEYLTDSEVIKIRLIISKAEKRV